MESEPERSAPSVRLSLVPGTRSERVAVGCSRTTLDSGHAHDPDRRRLTPLTATLDDGRPCGHGRDRGGRPARGPDRLPAGDRDPGPSRPADAGARRLERGPRRRPRRGRGGGPASRGQSPSSAPSATSRAVARSSRSSSGRTASGSGSRSRPRSTRPRRPTTCAGRGRRVFTIDGLTFGIAICHEAFRYPEITRSLALAGAQVVFVPHFVTTDDGSLPTDWCDALEPVQREGADAPGARELDLHRPVERGRPRPGFDHRDRRAGRVARREPAVRGASASSPPTSISTLATGLLAQRWAPDRNVFA